MAQEINNLAAQPLHPNPPATHVASNVLVPQPRPDPIPSASSSGGWSSGSSGPPPTDQNSIKLRVRKPKRFDLLDLPRELRDTVYAEYAGPDTIFNLNLQLRSRPLVHQLMLVNRQISTEYSEHVGIYNGFFFHPAANVPDLRKLWRVAPSLTAAMRRCGDAALLST